MDRAKNQTGAIHSYIGSRTAGGLAGQKVYAGGLYERFNCSAAA